MLTTEKIKVLATKIKVSLAQGQGTRLAKDLEMVLAKVLEMGQATTLATIPALVAMVKTHFLAVAVKTRCPVLAVKTQFLVVVKTQFLVAGTVAHQATIWVPMAKLACLTKKRKKSSALLAIILGQMAKLAYLTRRKMLSVPRVTT